ncbi:sialidase family protein [Actinomyces naeslundii]|uniref:exo-alpha-sialidase n=2 Tax=Actinomyces naeslundii TaxID=1655 RepID=J3F4I6_ACTNH|nr:sialidase family protein [Actinomyces naeslundii]EJN85732.1 putative exo-alpha-sialidase [Actinomyces naeslundii str. Howell 279]OMG32169.1 sialidase [Actinomyces naeslundii]QQC21594.1 exo-alpha-sialidase [Actinomyces naeslundii]
MTSKHPFSLRRLSALLGSLPLAVTGMIAVAPPAHATPTADGLMDIAITQVNAPEDGLYAVGDVMTFNITLTNTSSEAHSFAPASTNLSGNVTKCRWRNVPAGATKTDCAGLATHTVTAEDLKAGSFTPQIAYEVKAVEYTGQALNTPETISGAPSPVKSASLRVESFTPSSNQEAYKLGDTVSYTVRIRSVSDKTINVAATDSSFDDLARQCHWGNLRPGKGAVYNCKPLTHTITQADVDAGRWTPSITLTATGTDGAALQTLTATGNPISVVGQHPQAEPAPAPDASTELPASMSEAQHLAGNTATDNYRIPAITTAPNGDLLVSYDERPKDNGNGGSDAPNPNHIVQRRSADGGKTWSAPTYIHQGTETGKKVGYSDPSYVVDHQTGTIFNFHVKSYDQGWSGSKAGTDPENRSIIQAEVSTSTDNGWTWTHRTITADITKDNPWTARFAASGQGIQIQHGAHAGRLVQQYTIRTADGTVQAVSVYSDDHGKTWQAGTPTGTGMDENKVVELSDGSLMLNSRASDGSGFRKVARSTDGGQTWSEPASDKNLPDSVDNAQIIRAFPNAAPSDPRAKVLLLSHSPNPKPWSRDRGTISMSCDDGASWATGKVFNENFVGYTTIAVQSDGSIGLLSEDGNYGGIWYRNFTMNWLGEQCGQKQPEPSPTPSPSAAPSAAPTTTPSSQPAPEPTSAPEPEPTAAPSEQPSTAPSEKPSTEPTAAPAPEPSSAAPSTEPTQEPTQTPTAEPSAEPTQAPSEQPSSAPSEKPSSAPAPSATGQAPSTVSPDATSVPTPSDRPSSSATPSRAPGATPAPSTQPDEIDRPADGTMAQPTKAAGAPSASATGAATTPGRGLSQTGTNALLVLGLAGVAVVGGYLLLRARRTKN